MYEKENEIMNLKFKSAKHGIEYQPQDSKFNLPSFPTPPFSQHPNTTSKRKIRKG